jgi:small subunit ribosomal protein S16
MAVRIRLKRTGAKNKPCYRIVVADARSQRDGRFIENLGFYDPRHNDEQIDVERADYWVSVGAQPTDTVSGIIKRAKGETKPAVEVEEKKQEVKKETAAE